MTVKDVPVTDAGSIASLKVTEIAVLTATPVVPLEGLLEEIVGGVKSEEPPPGLVSHTDVKI